LLWPILVQLALLYFIWSSYTCSIPSLQVEPELVDCPLHEVLSIRGVNSRKPKQPLSNNDPVTCVRVLLMLTHVSHLFPQSISSGACYCYFLLYMRICIQGRAFPAGRPERRHSSFVIVNYITIVDHFKEKGDPNSMLRPDQILATT
jgi:hypothetical protein